MIKLKDNSQTKKDVFEPIKNLTKKIANKTLEQLEHENVFVFPESIQNAEDISKDQMVIRSVNDSYRTGNIMGFLGCGEERLVIESRFCGEKKDYFFWYLLSKVFDYPNIIDLKSDSDQNDRLLSLLLFLFPYYLKTAMRKGLFKTYVFNAYNDDHVKGIIDVERHIERNTPFVGKIAYNLREFSYDNDLMALIRHTIEWIKRKPYGSNLLLKVKDEVSLVRKVTTKYEQCNRQAIIEKNKKVPVNHAYFKEYFALQKLCLAILQNQKHRIGAGSKQIYGILFDGAWLWEEYIYRLIKDSFHHPMNKCRKGREYFFDGNIGQIFPDFISRSEPRIIADAKYKPIINICSRDYIQLLAYMFRFDAKQGYYFYPETQDYSDRILQLNRGLTCEANVEARGDVSIVKHGLKIPADEMGYEQFVEKMKENEKVFKHVFNDLIRI